MIQVADAVFPKTDATLLQPETLVPRQRLFRMVLLLKGLNGIAEIGGAAAFLLLPGSAVASTISGWADHELAEDAGSLAAHTFQSWSAVWMQGDHGFAGIFILIHGLAKLALVLLMATGRTWAYPVAVAVFGGLLAFALTTLTSFRSWALATFALFDVFAIWVIWREWRALHLSVSAPRAPRTHPGLPAHG